MKDYDQPPIYGEECEDGCQKWERVLEPISIKTGDGFKC